MYPSLKQVLELEDLQAAGPRVVANEHALDRTVRWLHVAELVDVGGLLRGGELLVTTGVMLPDDEAGLDAYVQDLASVSAAGLIVEIGHRYKPHLPPALVASAQRHGLVLIELARKAQFVRITEAVHTLVINSQVGVLRATTEMHRVFTQLSMEGATPQQVVSHLAALAGHAAVLEDPGHRVICVDAHGRSLPALLQHWERRSRQVLPPHGPTYVEDRGWLVTPVTARGKHWGRLFLLVGDRPTPLLEDLVERAASTLALNWLLDSDEESLEGRAHRTLITGLLDSTLALEEVGVRAQALGVPLVGRNLLGLVLRMRPVPDRYGGADAGALKRLNAAAQRATARANGPALLGVIDSRSIALLLSVEGGVLPEHALQDWYSNFKEQLNLAGDVESPRAPVVAVGSVVGSVAEARRSILEARQVADVAQYEPTEGWTPRRIGDLGVRGLLHLLKDDERLVLFIQRQIGSLLAHDKRHSTDLVDILDLYLTRGRNKTAASDASNLSRPAFYERLRRIQRIVNVDLDSPEDCIALYVAITAHRMRAQSAVISSAATSG